MEKSGEKDIDKMAGCFGKIMEEIFAWKQDVWEDTLRRMGFFLGKFIYLLGNQTFCEAVLSAPSPGEAIGAASRISPKRNSCSFSYARSSLP